MGPTTHQHEIDPLDKASKDRPSRFSQEQEPQFDLSEYIELAIRWRRLILASFFTLVIPVGIWSFLATKIYEVSMVIEPPIWGTSDLGVQDLDSVANIKAKIESGAYDVKIIRDLKLDDKELAFKIEQLRAGLSPMEMKDVKALKISLRRAADKVDSGKQILRMVLASLNGEYARFIQAKGNGLENRIRQINDKARTQAETIRNQTRNRVRTLESQINTKENEIKLKNEQYKILADKESSLLEQLKETKDNSQKLFDKRAALIEHKEGRDDISSLLYTATIQQNISYFTQMQSELSALKAQKENILTGIENTKNSINESRIEMENLQSAARIDIDALEAARQAEIRALELTKGNLESIVVVQEPEVSIRPVGPKKIRNILMAGMAGLMLGLCAAIFLEWWGSRLV